MIPTTDIVAAGVPSGWRTVPFWSLFRREKRTGFPDEELLSVYRDFGVIPKSSRDDNHNKPSEDLSGYQLVTKGALVTNKMKAWQGSIAISRYRGIVSPAYYVYTPQSAEHDQFLHYLLRSDPYIALYGRISKGVRVNQWDLEHEALRNIPVLLPDLETQRKIADFLERETARIDLLIEKKLELQLKIAEKQSAFFERALSRGFSEGQQTKDTGLPWLPQIPATWKITAIKRLVEVKDGTHETPSYVDASESSFPLVTSKDFVGDAINFAGAKWIGAQDHKAIYRRSNTEKGDLLMSMIGGNIGKCLIVEDDRDFSIKNVALFKTGNDTELANLILCFLRSSLFFEQLRLLGRGGAQDFIGLGDIRNLLIPVIPLSERSKIVAKTSRQAQYSAKVGAVIHSTVSRLQEFRSALITAAVTGQIDVASHSRSGATERRLYALQEEMDA